MLIAQGKNASDETPKGLRIKSERKQRVCWWGTVSVQAPPKKVKTIFSPKRYHGSNKLMVLQDYLTLQY